MLLLEARGDLRDRSAQDVGLNCGPCGRAGQHRCRGPVVEMAPPRASTLAHRRFLPMWMQWTVAACFFTVLGLLVVYPLLRPGWSLLLDWTPGPHDAMPRSAWGLDGGFQG